MSPPAPLTLPTVASPWPRRGRVRRQYWIELQLFRLGVFGRSTSFRGRSQRVPGDSATDGACSCVHTRTHLVLNPPCARRQRWSHSCLRRRPRRYVIDRAPRDPTLNAAKTCSLRGSGASGSDPRDALLCVLDIASFSRLGWSLPESFPASAAIMAARRGRDVPAAGGAARASGRVDRARDVRDGVTITNGVMLMPSSCSTRAGARRRPWPDADARRLVLVAPRSCTSRSRTR